jgi:hypothetical protein
VTTKQPLPANVGSNFADKRQSLGRYSSLADYGHGVWLVFYIKDKFTIKLAAHEAMLLRTLNMDTIYFHVLQISDFTTQH